MENGWLNPSHKTASLPVMPEKKKAISNPTTSNPSLPREKKTFKEKALSIANFNTPSEEQFFTPPTTQLDEAALYLEEELSTIRDRFETGEMQAFGTQQGKMLKDFQEIRKMQAQLSMKQVATLGELMNQQERKDPLFMELNNLSDGIKEEQHSFEILNDMLERICKSIEGTSPSSKKTQSLGTN